MWLTRLALRNPILILMMSIMVLALGALSSSRLSVDLFPNIDIPVIRVATFYPGAGPEDIEKSITQPIERAVASSPGVDRVESTSKQGASIVAVWFNYGVNLDTAQFEVQQRVAQIQSQLPPGIQNPYILKFDVTNIPVVQVVIRGEGLDEKQLYDLTYNVIQPQLERLPGIASATVSGGKQREIEVKVDRDQLRARGLGILDVVNAVRGANLLLPSGNLRAGDQDYSCFRAEICAPEIRTTTSSRTRRSTAFGSSKASSSGKASRPRPARWARARRRCASAISRAWSTERPIRRTSYASTERVASTSACSSSRAQTRSRRSMRCVLRFRPCVAFRRT
jgi:multidrug efflux pump subunit AcrB